MKVIVNGSRNNDMGEENLCFLYHVCPSYVYNPIPCTSFQFCHTNNISLDVCPEYLPFPKSDSGEF